MTPSYGILPRLPLLLAYTINGLGVSCLRALLQHHCGDTPHLPLLFSSPPLFLRGRTQFEKSTFVMGLSSSGTMWGTLHAPAGAGLLILRLYKQFLWETVNRGKKGHMGRKDGGIFWEVGGGGQQWAGREEEEAAFLFPSLAHLLHIQPSLSTSLRPPSHPPIPSVGLLPHHGSNHSFLGWWQSPSCLLGGISKLTHTPLQTSFINTRMSRI